jgi:hypothetical protein
MVQALLFCLSISIRACCNITGAGILDNHWLQQLNVTDQLT